MEDKDYLICDKCGKPLWGRIRKKAPEPLLENLICVRCSVTEPDKVIVLRRRRKPGGECIVPQCTHRSWSRGFCNSHYSKANEWRMKSRRTWKLFEDDPLILNLRIEQFREFLGRLRV